MPRGLVDQPGVANHTIAQQTGLSRPSVIAARQAASFLAFNLPLIFCERSGFLS